jgi:hypothetical protein
MKGKGTPWEQRRTIGGSIAKSTSCTIGQLQGGQFFKINQLFVDDHDFQYIFLNG